MKRADKGTRPSSRTAALRQLEPSYPLIHTIRADLDLKLCAPVFRTGLPLSAIIKYTIKLPAFQARLYLFSVTVAVETADAGAELRYLLNKAQVLAPTLPSTLRLFAF